MASTFYQRRYGLKCSFKILVSQMYIMIVLLIFTPYIIQSPHTTEVLTDSRPCVQAYEKLKRGEFSASSRVTTFLSTVSRYSVHIRHIAGVENLPSDFASRNPKECLDSRTLELEDSVVRSLSVTLAVLPGRLPSWNAERLVVPRSVLDGLLTALHIRLSHPSKYVSRNPKECLDSRTLELEDSVVRSLSVTLAVLPGRLPSWNAERLVVPRSVLDGLLTALHIRLSHPSKYLESSSCHTCESVKSIPKHFQPQSEEARSSSVHWRLIRC